MRLGVKNEEILKHLQKRKETKSFHETTVYLFIVLATKECFYQKKYSNRLFIIFRIKTDLKIKYLLNKKLSEHFSNI